MEVVLNCTLSVGEVFDKISILEIKKEKIRDLAKRDSICRECDLLYKKIEIFPELERRDFLRSLKDINSKLWNVEEELRVLESLGHFDEKFIALARSVYKLNDQRFSIKDKVNIHFGSYIREVKSY
ncbi:MAG: hypothetical protein CME68_00835 [Halobacteriovoraceae bacterium]|nr:hypothetical protein [Halobacteriovoraceae bacterium]